MTFAEIIIFNEGTDLVKNVEAARNNGKAKALETKPIAHVTLWVLTSEV